MKPYVMKIELKCDCPHDARGMLRELAEALWNDDLSDDQDCPQEGYCLYESGDCIEWRRVNGVNLNVTMDDVTNRMLGL